MRTPISVVAATSLLVSQLAFAVPALAQRDRGYGNPGNGYGNLIRCESWQYRYNECRADTRGGVDLQRVIAGDCRRGNWGWRQGEIWVNNGCRAEFSTRHDNSGYYPDDRDKGPSAGVIVGGVAIVAGLAALIAASKKKSDEKAAANQQANQPASGKSPETAPHTGHEPPARITANLDSLAAAARPAMNVCLSGAAAQIGATGGTEIQLGEISEIVKGNGGYRFRMTLRGVYPDETRDISTYCRATPTDLVELTFG